VIPGFKFMLSNANESQSLRRFRFSAHHFSTSRITTVAITKTTNAATHKLPLTKSLFRRISVNFPPINQKVSGYNKHEYGQQQKTVDKSVPYNLLPEILRLSNLKEKIDCPAECNRTEQRKQPENRSAQAVRERPQPCVRSQAKCFECVFLAEVMDQFIVRSAYLNCAWHWAAIATGGIQGTVRIHEMLWSTWLMWAARSGPG